MKYLKSFENITWMNDIVKQDMGELSTVSDDYYRMDLKDVDIINSDEKILYVDFYEKNNKKFRGSGKFKYNASKIEGLSGDIVPIKMDGILVDVFEEDAEAIIDFLYYILKDLSL